MIAAQDLRIGNWVRDKQIGFKDDFKISVGDLLSITEGCQYNPIPLTPEILEKCGFKGIGSDFEINEVHIYSGHQEFWYWNDKVEVKLTSLHQLQNLYFALTGTELTYSPKIKI